MPKPAGSDEVLRILGEEEAHAAPPPAAAVEREPPGFDNAAYLRANPDVIDALRRGDFRSGYHHYAEAGFREGRPLGLRGADPRNAVLEAPGLRQRAVNPASRPAAGFEVLSFSPSGGLMLVGWLNDTAAPLDSIQIVSESWRIILDRSKVIRIRRTDVEALIGGDAAHAFGILGFLWAGQTLPSFGSCVVEYWLANGQVCTQAVQPRASDDVEQLNTLLGYLAGAHFYGNTAVEAVAALDGGVGAEVLKANRFITRRICAAPFAQRFGQKARIPRGSIIVVLYGKPEFLFLQNALYAGLPGIDDYEFIYVSNSPEMAEALFREARRADRLYGLSQTIVVLPGNAGFGAANNAGVNYARSNRILIVNPDVFPKDPSWARRHVDLIGNVRAEQCRLFGVPLYYDDGSLMHGGMYFEIDGGLTFQNGVPRTIPMVRVEHYGKGAPPDTPRYVRPRPVPAIGGAFISIDRAWFQTLGGFSEEYVFGHYEDADLCLKSLDQGTPPWLQDIRMWHLEGKGSQRRPPHEGASIVNRWVFSQSWAALIEAEIRGPAPRHALLRDTGAAPVVEAAVTPAAVAGVAAEIGLGGSEAGVTETSDVAPLELPPGAAAAAQVAAKFSRRGRKA